jgi:hypothetical protein
MQITQSKYLFIPMAHLHFILHFEVTTTGSKHRTFDKFGSTHIISNTVVGNLPKICHGELFSGKQDL